jgi:modulator of FtsH protease HflC
MNQTKLMALAGLLLLVFVVVNATIYTVDEREKAVVVRFGEVVRLDAKPGLHIKTPFLEDVRFYDSRILTLDAEPQPFLTKEKKSVLVDS